MATTDQVRRRMKKQDLDAQPGYASSGNDVGKSLRDDRHDHLAFDLERLASLRAPRSSAPAASRRPLAVGTLRPVPLGRDDAPLVSVHRPSAGFDELVLSEDNESLFKEILREHQHRDLLLSRGLSPRRRLLFTGPSGTGKTRSADAFAYAMGIPLVKVRLAAVVSSYLGETSRHLDEIMDFASHGSWVIVFDEIDMFGAERDRDDHGEMRRVVTAFLQSLEDSKGENVVIATTNHPGILDRALWRRFDEVAAFSLPTKSQIEKLLSVKLRRMHGRINRSIVAQGLTGMTHAEIEMVCYDAMREAALDGRASLTTENLLVSARTRSRRLQKAGRALSAGD